MAAPAADERRAIRDAVVASLEQNLPNARREMLAIVVATGLIGFVVSAGLLHAGVSSMARRYSIATLAAYGAFLLLVRLWAERRRRQLGSWMPPSAALRARPPRPAPPRPVGDSSESRVNPWVVEVLVGLIDELAVLAVICSWVVAVAFVVWTAPVLLAEVLLDLLLVAGLYRSLRSLEPQSWLRTAVRHTWMSAVVVVVLLAVFGFVVQTALPQVDSIGDVLRL